MNSSKKNKNVSNFKLNKIKDEYAHAVSINKFSSCYTQSNNAIAASLGFNGRAAKSGSWIILVDYQKNNINRICTAKVGYDKIDGILIEGDTWHWFNDGKLQSKSFSFYLLLLQKMKQKTKDQNTHGANLSNNTFR